MKTIKNIFRMIGSFFKLIFANIYYSLNFILDNTVGLIFNKAFSGYNKTFEKEDKWYKIRLVILIVLLLAFIFSFKIIYSYTFEKIFSSILVSIGKLFHPDNTYHKVLVRYGNRYAEGIGTTIYLALIGTTTGFLLAIIFSLLATLKVFPEDGRVKVFFKKLGAGFVKVYTTVLRGTPMMVQAMIIYWGVKNLVKANILLNSMWTFLVAALVVVSLNTAAYLTEVLKGGIESVDKGQMEGGLSLGLTPSQTMMSIIFPQAIKNSMASIGNEFVINIKDTSVLSVILVVDLFRAAEEAQIRLAADFEPFIIVAIIYLILTITVTSILKKVSKVLDVPVIELPSAN